jgi:pimeloyl-ACP methyl ester carboxylesterase
MYVRLKFSNISIVFNHEKADLEKVRDEAGKTMTEKRLYKVKEAAIAAAVQGPEDAPLTLVWGHGWGRNSAAFSLLSQPFTNNYRNIFIDFPGFGDSLPPDSNWGTEEYADAAAEILKEIKGKKIWVGHSFGCRVGLQLAAKYPHIVDGFFLISAAGLKRKHPFHKKIYIKARIKLFKFLKKIIPRHYLPQLYKIFGSRDYQDAGVMREIFLKVVNEDLGNKARQIKCPVHLIYGDKDSETPLEIGQRLNMLIPASKLTILEGLNHYSVLSEGRHQVAEKLMEFIRNSRE